MNSVTSVPGSYGLDDVLKKKYGTLNDQTQGGNFLSHINNQQSYANNNIDYGALDPTHINKNMYSSKQ